MPFGQVVFGPPGSGKTTYCHGLQQFFSAVATASQREDAHKAALPKVRNLHIVNLDPANNPTTSLPYTASVDISDLISLEQVMRPESAGGLGLGPNGGMIYCIEYLLENFDWLEDELASLGKDAYIVFDLPGQVELVTHHGGVRTLVERLGKSLDLRLVAVHLCDSYYCTSPDKYISVLLLSLQTMLSVGLPHINVLSKVDMIERYGKLAFRLPFYTNVLDLSHLLDLLNSEEQSPFTARFRQLNTALVELVEDFGLVSFKTLAVEDARSVATLVKEIDRAGGFVFAGGDEGISASAMSAEYGYGDDEDAQDRWIDYRDEYREYEQEQKRQQRNIDEESIQIVERS